MKNMFLYLSTLGLLISALDFFFGHTGWGLFLVVMSGINLYNYFTWDKKMAKLLARREELLLEHENEKIEQQRKIDELYGK